MLASKPGQGKNLRKEGSLSVISDRFEQVFNAALRTRVINQSFPGIWCDFVAISRDG